jgi:tRNA pseudouridine55 synthase
MEKVMLHSPTRSLDRTTVLSAAASPLVVSGVLVLDKPEERTSFSVVNEIKKLLKVAKVGHCGTLDPFATGVFVLCLNRATRIADQLLEQDKAYRCEVCFGFESSTQDKTGEILPVYEGPPVSEVMLRQALDRFEGTYDQQVPRYAAVKIQGQRLYSLSRKGISIDLPHRLVRIHAIRLLAFKWPEAVIEVHCSKGTYIRQLADDIGRELHCGAYLKELRRLSSGAFTLDQAMSLREFREVALTKHWQEKVIGMNEALAHLPSLPIASEEVVKRLQVGHLDPALELDLKERFSTATTSVRLVAEWNNDLVALRLPSEDGRKQPRLRVFGVEDRRNGASSTR